MKTDARRRLLMIMLLLSVLAAVFSPSPSDSGLAAAVVHTPSEGAGPMRQAPGRQTRIPAIHSRDENDDVVAIFLASSGDRSACAVMGISPQTPVLPLII